MKPTIAILFPLFVLTSTLAHGADSYDIVVYGGTSGGVTAAVAAARMGKSVVLIEPGTVRTGFIDEMTNRAEALLGQDSRYEAQYRRFLRLAKPYERAAMSPERVARAIERALTDARPLPRYLVGADAWLMRVTNAVLPTRARHAVTRFAAGLRG